jgi:hypothetical protein
MVIEEQMSGESGSRLAFLKARDSQPFCHLHLPDGIRTNAATGDCYGRVVMREYPKIRAFLHTAQVGTEA